jgi:predicted  nucleic acid-binding Zn-ribbon protein
MSVSDLDQRVDKLESQVKALESIIQKSRNNRSELSKLKADLKKPVKRTPADIEDIMSIAGTFEGPEDLSQHFRSYLCGERK